MTDIVVVPRPENQSIAYLFVKLTDADQVFKITKKLQTTDKGQLVISLGVSPVDEDGVALLSPAGTPDITFHSHTFTAEELSDPDFDANARVSELITTLVNKKQNEIVARQQVAALGGEWEINP